MNWSRYLAALFALIAIAEGIWLYQRSRYECDDKRCIARDVEFLNLLEQLGSLRHDAGLLTRQNVFLAQRAKKYRAEKERLEERLTAAEAQLFVRGDLG